MGAARDDMDREFKTYQRRMMAALMGISICAAYFFYTSAMGLGEVKERERQCIEAGYQLDECEAVSGSEEWRITLEKRHEKGVE